MEEKTKKLLEFLEPNGLIKYANIAGVLNELFSWADLHNPATQNKAREVWDFMQGIESANLVKMRDRAVYDLGVGNITEGYRWFNTRPIDAVITANGLNELYKERQKGSDEEIKNLERQSHISTIRLNGELEKNIPLQTIIQRTTMYAIILTGIVAFAALVKDSTKSNEMNVLLKPQTDTLWQKQTQALDSLDKRLRQIDTTLKTLKTISTKH